MLAKFLKYSFRFLFYSFAAILIFFAAAMGVLRLALPDLGNYKTEIVEYLEQTTGYPLQIGEIHADWVGWMPKLNINSISIYNEDSSQSILDVENARLSFDLLSCLRTQSIIPNQITISGTRLTIARLEDGSIIIVESGTNLSNRNNKNNYDLTKWFKQQNKIQINSVDLTWVDRMNHKPAVLFKNTNFTVSTVDDEIILEGNVNLAQNNNLATLYFKADLFGDITTSDWSGTINIDGSNINPALIVNQLDLFNFKPGNNLGDGTVESRFSHAKLKSLNGDFVFKEFVIANQDADNLIHNVELNLDLLRHDEGWRARTDISYLTDTLAIDNDPDKIQIESNIGKDNKVSSVSVNSNRLDLDLLASIMQQYTSIDGVLDKLKIQTATIDDLQLNYSNNKQNENDLNILNLSAGEIHLSAPEVYKTEKTLNNLNTTVSWQALNETTKRYDFENIDFATEAFTANINGSLKTDSAENDSELVLSVAIPEFPLTSIPEYLPKTKNKPLEKWVNKSLKGGNGKNIQFHINGSLSEFPFKSSDNGDLSLTAEIEDAEVLYQDEWPVLTAGNGVIQLDGTKFNIDVHSANILDTTMEGLQATIPEIITRKPRLKLNGNIQTLGEQLSEFINKSPLQKRKSLLIVNDINLKGPTEIAVDLDIPLYPEDKTAVNGHIVFQDNSIHHEKFKMKMTDLNGRLDFTRHTVWAEALTASYADQTVNLNIPKTDNGKSGYILINGVMDKALIAQQLTHYIPKVAVEIIPYLEYVSGKTHWQTKYDLSPDKTDKKLEIRSNLQGMVLDFPQPLKKPAADITELSVSIPLKNSEQIPLVFRLKDRLLASMTYSNNDDDSRLISMLVDFNQQQQTTGNDQGIKLTGHIPYFDLPAWLNTIHSSEQDGVFNPNSIFQNKTAKLSIDTLKFYDYEFPNLTTTVQQTAGNWSIDVDSERIAGDISIPRNLETVQLDLNRLNLEPLATEQTSTTETSTIKTSSVPDIDASVEDFIFIGARLGALELKTKRTGNVITFEKIHTSNDTVTVNANGSWQDNTMPGSTQVDFKVEAETVNDLMATLDWDDTTIKEGKLSLEINSQWQGSPQDYSLEKVNGDLDINIDKGTMLEIDPKAGRLVSLFSIQSLPRRLSLDFSDLFDEGLQFDNISGHFSLSDGHAYTNDLVMLGPTAKIAMNGRTGLIARDYDQMVTVTPKISGNLPVAGAIFGPIGIGVGTAIYFAGEIFDSIPEGIDNLAQVKYSVTGSWDEPLIEDYEKTMNEGEVSEPVSSIGEAIKK